MVEYMAKMIRSPVLILVYGSLLWLLTFLISWALDPVKGSSIRLFDSLMPVALAFLTAWFLWLYFKNVSTGYLREGVVAGLAWLVIGIVLDQPLFMWGPMKMSFVDYMYDIGVAYCVIPVVTVSTGYIVEMLLSRRGPDATGTSK